MRWRAAQQPSWRRPPLTGETHQLQVWEQDDDDNDNDDDDYDELHDHLGGAHQLQVWATAPIIVENKDDHEGLSNNCEDPKYKYKEYIVKLYPPGGVLLKDPSTSAKITTAISKNVLFRFIYNPYTNNTVSDGCYTVAAIYSL